MDEARPPRMRFTMIPTGPNGERAQLRIENIDPINIKAGESKVFMLVEVDDPQRPADKPQ